MILDDEAQEKEDARELLKSAAFRRFLFRVTQRCGIFSTSTDGSEGRDLAVTAQARKHLGLEILAMVELGQPQAHPEGLPILTMIQILREEANKPPQEKSNNGRRSNRNDRYRDLDDADGDDE